MWARRCSVISKLIALTCFLSLAPFTPADDASDKPYSIDFGPKICDMAIDINAKGNGVLNLKDVFNQATFQYPLYCGITLYTTKTEKMSIKVNFYRVGENGKTYYCRSQLEIFDGPNKSFPKKVGGCSDDKSFFSSGNSLYISMTMYKHNPRPTIFAIEVQDLLVSSSCSENAVTMVAKDEYQTLNIREDKQYYQCKWKLMADEGNRVEIEVTYFNVHDEEDCPDRDLQIYDGMSDESKRLARLCRKITSKPKYRTTQNYAYVRVKTNSPKGQVKLRYRQIAMSGNSGEKAGMTAAMICLSVLFALISKAF